MAVKAVVLDLDGTLLNSAVPVPGVAEMITDLRNKGMWIGIASNRPAAERRVKAARLDHNLVLEPGWIGVKKGSPIWVEAACSAAKVARNEIVWLGDDVLDMRSAAHAHIPYFHALWSGTNSPYGIKLSAPQSFIQVLTEFFLEPSDWYWKLDRSDAERRKVQIYALMDTRGAGIPLLEKDLRDCLKWNVGRQVGPYKLLDFMMLHLAARLFAGAIFGKVNLLTVYPSRAGGPSQSIAPYADFLAKLFGVGVDYVNDLLVRHTPAKDSGQTRFLGGEVGFLNQANTVHVNAGCRKQVRGKTVLVLDDFINQGHSLECARNLLLRAGADTVIGVAVGKYGAGNPVLIQVPQSDLEWDAFQAIEHDDGAFRVDETVGELNEEARTAMRQSYERLATSEIQPPSG